MIKTDQEIAYVIDKVTGKLVSNIGAEVNRQKAEETLLEKKGFSKEDIAVDTPVSIEVNGQDYTSALDLLVSVGGTPVMVIKCAAGSLDSRQKEVIAAARVCIDPIPPIAASTDGSEWLLWDVKSGKQMGRGADSVPDKSQAIEILTGYTPEPLEGKALMRERLIFRSYDMDNVNVARKA
ncbi:Type I restriction enzyme R protein N terminus (HSDR_N) [Desulfatibacillum alkenivorans DSM 16219]|uniref:Type I restriction enzyme R protein N terminus (HSDR_N) n=1 Tax=Desulfatibacillum alkenivorans DSM 16219 TaxID=1121393 RepID=A0A1M6SBY6_9BACT|nr:type I restriction enzyme HsdR N-terminal domain-containing protein [Desulfatibacillum alkenivorans]SHK42274.1 Type I restriction enzyme R protein N terminus (HSDR_N) [Desulfatibacillum alkenivorans DSM 16219]